METNRFNWRSICIGDFVRLKGKTRKGKNRINQHGDVWEVIDEQLTKILLQSLEKTFKDTPGRVAEKDWRWISATEDRDFEVVELIKGEAA